MSEEPGTITHGEQGDLFLGIGGERFVLASDEVRNLLFTGRVTPVTDARRVRRDDGSEAVEVAIVGHAAINRAGRAVLFHTTAGHFIIPLVSLQRVARGEAVSAPLFPLVPDWEAPP
ncbi:MAG: hypothetical protein JXA08_04270 [Methanomicrobiaceae archaeon]|nr:hypothetical protein [Methanomicrobiaceae archaeon]